MVVPSLALAVFLLTYLLISFREIPRLRMTRSRAALLGAHLMLFLGILAPMSALDSIDLGVIALLLGMMLLASSLRSSGFFERVCELILKHSPTPMRLFLLVTAASAALSALVLNDAVVLLLTPVIVEACLRLGVRPLPYLIAEAVGANVGSVATVVGNPQNAYIAARAGIGFLEFSATLAPVAAVCLLSSVLLMAFFFREDLSGTRFPRALDHPLEALEPLREGAACRSRGCLVPRRGLTPILLVLTLSALMGFVTSGWTGLPISGIALAAGCAAALLSLGLSDPTPREIGRGVDWSILIFFSGLFMLIRGLGDSGVLSMAQDALAPLLAGGPDVASLSLVSALLSNLVSNVPGVMLLAEMLPIEGNTLWLALAASSTLAGNATLLGSAANIIVAESAGRMGQELRFWEFLRVGLPVTVVNLLICVLMLGLAF